MANPLQIPTFQTCLSTEERKIARIRPIKYAKLKFPHYCLNTPGITKVATYFHSHFATLCTHHRFLGGSLFSVSIAGDGR